MKWSMLVLFLGGILVSAQQTTVPQIPYHSVPGFLQLPPNVYFGEVPGVAVNSKKHVFVFSRGNSTGPAYGAAAAQLLEFDADGKFLHETATTSTPGPRPIPSKSIRTTTSGSLTKAPTW